MSNESTATPEWQKRAWSVLSSLGFAHATTRDEQVIQDALAAAFAEGQRAEREALRRERAEYRGHGPLFVDATPDGQYAIRLLTAYAAADVAGEWISSQPDSIAAVLNDANRRRAVELQRAIAQLAAGQRSQEGATRDAEDRAVVAEESAQASAECCLEWVKRAQQAETALAAKEAALAEAREVARESNAACTCGCALTDHENYGDEGLGCGDPMHECQLCSQAVAAHVAGLRAQLAAQQETVRRLESALSGTAQSLRTIERGAGHEEGLDAWLSVRGYAHSRADVAEAALKEQL